MDRAATDPRYGRGSMAKNAALVIALTVLSRLLGVLRESVIANQFGTSDPYAAYRLAFRVPDTIYLLVIGGALGTALIPVFTAHLAKRDYPSAWQLASRVLNLALLVALVVAGLAFLLAPWLVRWVIAPGFSPALQAETVRLVRLLLLQPILLGLGGLAMAMLNAFRRFLLTSLAPVVYNLGIIGGAVFLAPRWGIDGLVAGVLIGAGLYLLTMVPGLVRCRMRYILSLDWRDADVRAVGRLLGPRLLGQMAFQLNFVAIGALATFEGGLAVNAIDYAYRLLFLPLGILGVSLGQVAFPTLAALANERRLDAFRRTLARVLRVALFLALPSMALLVVLRVPIIELLFERGAFTAADTTATAQAFLFFIVELPAAIALEIILRAFYALHDTRTPALAAIAAVVLNVALGAGLQQVIGFPGLALSFALATTLQSAVLFFLLHRRVERIEGVALLRSGLRSLGGALLAAVAVIPLQPWLEGVLPGVGLVDQALRLGLLALLGGAIYLAATALLGSPELREAWALLRRRFDRSQGA